MAKGIAVVSGSTSTLKHKLMDDGVATLGTAGKTSVLSGTIDLHGESQNDLAARINAESGSVAGRISTALGKDGDIMAEINTTSTDMVGDNSRDYVVDGSTNYINTASSLIDADSKLDTQMAVTSGSLEKLLDPSVSREGSMANLIDKYLKGANLQSSLNTMNLLSASIAISDLSSSVDTAIQEMKLEVSGANGTLDTLRDLELDILAHTSSAKQADSTKDTNLGNAADAIGLETNRTLTYVGSNTTFLEQKSTIDTAQAELESKDGANVTTLTTLTGTLMTTETLKVPENKNATFKGETKFSTSGVFSAPVVTLTSAGEVMTNSTPVNGEMVYVKIGAGFAQGLKFAGTDDLVPEDNKFYFYENGRWFASPFHSEEE